MLPSASYPRYQCAGCGTPLRHGSLICHRVTAAFGAFSDSVDGALISAISGRAHTARAHDRRQYTRRHSQFLTLLVQHRPSTMRLLYCGAPGSQIPRMTWCWKPPWRPKVATSLPTIYVTLPGAGLRRISGLCPCVPRSFYTASGVESYEYNHRPITEVLACQN
jgi:hypothetical protein